ncbi:MAG: tRNA lysidine(34) synthetase TilS [Alcanivoracaceae bacterium]
MTPDTFSAFLQQALADVPGGLVLGVSGGLDSLLLLHGLCRAGFADRLLAVHVHHGLHPQADQWLDFCADQARQAGVRFAAERITVVPGGNLEARARQLRRRALIAHVDEGDVLLLAHHRHDQSETLLLRLLRGAGARGLAAMSALRHWQGREIRRPLLDMDRTTLEQLARGWPLHWIEDPANQAECFDRNFLRHRVLPVLRERWPDLDQRVGISAAVLAEQAALLDELAATDLQACDGDQHSLSLLVWAGLSAPRRRNLIHGWLRQRGMRPPSAAQLARIDTELVPASADRQPEIVWEDGVLVRYRERLWLLAPEARQPLEAEAHWNPRQQPWLSLGPMRVGVSGGDIALRDPGQSLEVRAARGGERILLRGLRREVSELWRAAGVPPWQRARLPLFFIAGELVAAAAIGAADGWSPGPGEPAFHLLIEDSAL